MGVGLRNARLLRQTFNMLYSAVGFIIHAVLVGNILLFLKVPAET